MGWGSSLGTRSVNERTRALVHRRIPHDLVLSLHSIADAIFVGSTYGPGGITAAVRIGFDDNRSLGSRETGGRLALPVFQELMLAVYRDKLLGAAPAFPAGMESRISAALLSPAPPPASDVAGDAVAHVFSW